MFESSQMVTIHSIGEYQLSARLENAIAFIVKQPFPVHHPDFWTVALYSGIEILVHKTQIKP